MNILNIFTLALSLFLVLPNIAFANGHDDNHGIHNDRDDFLECLVERFRISNVVYTPRNSSFASILRFSIQNLRFASQSTPKPLVIVTPNHESQIPPVIYCAKHNGMEMRTRSGGHDTEGLSYVSEFPFVMLDMINLSEVTVNAREKTTWVASGATLGSTYYRIAEQSPTLGFPAGYCPTVAVGGHVSGGGYGTLARKYGLSADNVIDARIINVNGRILDRRSMGEDLFWAIRGGGGASFGVVLAWKVKLVDVPETVTVFTVERTLEQNATQLVHRWQDIAHQFNNDLSILIYLEQSNTSHNGTNNLTVHARFKSLFLGGVDSLIPIMQQSFPELGLRREDCMEMTWIQSALYFADFPIDLREVLLNRTQPQVRYSKTKSDYVQKPIPVSSLEGLCKLLYEPEAKLAQIILTPYGGKMSEISEFATPFPHRAGNLYIIQYLVFWEEEEAQDSGKYISWIRKVYSYMAPYVSNSPRAVYIGYRDLDIGVNNDIRRPSYAQASIWGTKYFKNNFNRLVRVKTRVDPGNFFRNEQSFPSLASHFTKHF